MEKEELLKMNAADFLSQHYSEMPAQARKHELWSALKWLTIEELCTYTYSTIKKFKGVGQFTASSFEKILNENGLHFAEEEITPIKSQRTQKQTTSPIDWEQRRYEIAKVISATMLKLYWQDENNPFSEFIGDMVDTTQPQIPDVFIAEMVLDYTDILLSKLKEYKTINTQ